MSSDAIVVGGGVVGVCCAFELARRGASVVLVEREHDVAAGCSGGSAGLLCPSHAAPLATRANLLQGMRWLGRRESPFAIRPRPELLPWLARFVLACTPERERAATALLRELATRSLALHRELAAAGIETGLEERGVLYVCRSHEELQAAFAEAQATSPSARLLSVEQAVAVEPALDVAGVAGALYCPDEAHVDPVRLVHALADAARQAGVAIKLGTEAIRLRPGRRRIEGVETTEGELSADSVVVAAGAWSGRLARTAGVWLPLTGAKGYHVDLAAPSTGPRIPVFLLADRVVVTPFGDRVRLAGTLELSGLDLAFDAARLRAVERVGRRAVRGLAQERTVDLWCGLRPATPDGLPVVGRTEAFDNLLVATGHGTLGLLLGPLTGQLVAQLVSADEPGHDLTPLLPARFHRQQPFSPHARRPAARAR